MTSSVEVNNVKEHWKISKAVRILLLLLSLFLAVSSVCAQVRGIDVSHYQKNIDWEKVANSGVDFVYIKATEGATYVDPMFKKNI